MKHSPSLDESTQQTLRDMKTAQPEDSRIALFSPVLEQADIINPCVCVCDMVSARLGFFWLHGLVALNIDEHYFFKFTFQEPVLSECMRHCGVPPLPAVRVLLVAADKVIHLGQH